MSAKEEARAISETLALGASLETETAWQLIKTDLVGCLREIGFRVSEESGLAKGDRALYAGGSLQVIQARK